jgi:hypothetical protein
MELSLSLFDEGLEETLHFGALGEHDFGVPLNGDVI